MPGRKGRQVGSKPASLGIIIARDSRGLQSPIDTEHEGHILQIDEWGIEIEGSGTFPGVIEREGIIINKTLSDQLGMGEEGHPHTCWWRSLRWGERSQLVPVEITLTARGV